MNIENKQLNDQVHELWSDALVDPIKFVKTDIEGTYANVYKVSTGVDAKSADRLVKLLANMLQIEGEGKTILTIVPVLEGVFGGSNDYGPIGYIYEGRSHGAVAGYFE